MNLTMLVLSYNQGDGEWQLLRGVVAWAEDDTQDFELCESLL